MIFMIFTKINRFQCFNEEPFKATDFHDSGKINETVYLPSFLEINISSLGSYASDTVEI